MNSLPRMRCASVAFLFLAAMSAASVAQEEGSGERTPAQPSERFRDVLNSILDGPSRKPACLVDDAGLPKRLIVTCNGTALFEQPKHGAKRVLDLGINDRLYVFEPDAGSGYHRAGLTPWEDGISGWVPSVYCLPWDHNEILFLNGRSVPEGVDSINVWESEEEARAGHEHSATYVVPIDRETDAPRQFYPILEKSKDATLYKIGVLDWTDQRLRDEYGRRLPDAPLQEIARNLQVANILFLLNTDGAMTPYAERFSEEVPRMFDHFSNKRPVADDDFAWTLKFGCVAYQDPSKHFDVRVITPLTNDRKRIAESMEHLRDSQSSAGLEALLRSLENDAFSRGALNRIIWITNSSPTDLRDEVLERIGAMARSRYVQIDVFLCGGDKDSESAYHAIARRSGGSVHCVNEPVGLLPAVNKELEKRFAYIPLEQLFSESAIAFEKVYRAASLVRKFLALESPNNASGRAEYYRNVVRVRQLLASRGLDVRGWDLRSAWVKVQPDGKTALRPFVAVPRWQLADAISGALNSLEERGRGKDVPENTQTFLGHLLFLQAGPHALVGSASSAAKAGGRGTNLPLLSTALQRGEDGLSRSSRTYRGQLVRLIDYWRNSKDEAGGLTFIPLDMIP